MENTYTFTTYNCLHEEVKTYTYEAYSYEEAVRYALKVIANSRDNEAYHMGVTLK